MLSTTSAFTGDSTIASGLRNVANKTWCYVNVANVSGTAAITGATWTILTKPSGSNATISPISTIQWWAKFRPDVKGEYVIKVSMTTSAGSHDTTAKIYAAGQAGGELVRRGREQPPGAGRRCTRDRGHDRPVVAALARDAHAVFAADVGGERRLMKAVMAAA